MTNYRLTSSTRKALILAAIGLVLAVLLVLLFTNRPAAHATESLPTQSYTAPSDAEVPVAHIDSVSAHETYLPPCEQEDSHNCIWDASTAGNGEGDSFIDWRGHVYYIDPTMDYCTDEVPSACTPDSNN